MAKRHSGSKVKGWPIDGTLWTLDKNGAQTFYAQDVWSLVDHHCLLLRQFLSLLPEDSVIFLGAGSPCPDLTIIGRGQGLLGLAGDRSVLIHCVWARCVLPIIHPILEATSYSR